METGAGVSSFFTDGGGDSWSLYRSVSSLGSWVERDNGRTCGGGRSLGGSMRRHFFREGGSGGCGVGTPLSLII
jgi:hypothetical protein